MAQADLCGAGRAGGQDGDPFWLARQGWGSPLEEGKARESSLSGEEERGDNSADVVM